MPNRASILSLITMLALVNACGGESPTQPSPAQSFLLLGSAGR